MVPPDNVFNKGSISFTELIEAKLNVQLKALDYGRNLLRRKPKPRGCNKAGDLVVDLTEAPPNAYAHPSHQADEHVFGGVKRKLGVHRITLEQAEFLFEVLLTEIAGDL